MFACRAEEASYYRGEAEAAELKLTEAQNRLRYTALLPLKLPCLPGFPSLAGWVSDWIQVKQQRSFLCAGRLR